VEDSILDFFVLAGDINRDRSVNGTDFALLAASFGRTGTTFEQGDLNGDGSVNGSDFAILAGNFGRSLPAAQGVSSVAVSSPILAPIRSSGAPAARATGARRPIPPRPAPLAARPAGRALRLGPRVR
jgi:hypothetical protein